MAGQEHSSGAGQQSAATSDSAGDDSGLLSDIRSTWPWLSEASAKFLAQAIGAGRCPELGHQLRISAQGRGHKHNTPLSDVLVTVTSHSAFLRDFVDAFLSLLVEVLGFGFLSFLTGIEYDLLLFALNLLGISYLQLL